MHDPHSHSQPDVVRVTHADIAWNLLMSERRLEGSVTWTCERGPRATKDAELVLDAKGLAVTGVRRGRQGAMQDVAVDLRSDSVLRPAEDVLRWRFRTRPGNDVLGSRLVVPLRETDDCVEVRYHTTDRAQGLQWLDPEQTSSKTHPFLFSQAQAINARTFLPCQDSPGVRFTYTANVKAPEGLTVAMAAKSLGRAANGAFLFEMPQPIPSYLVAIAAGNLAFRSLGSRTGVYAEPDVLERAAFEFADTESMIVAAEKLYGPYRWERYDLIVLPPSFPFGGMENPRLTFATPTILAGDRSLVALVAHELAHSWSGNLVTNATWADFWLNEGFTVYFERRIVEAVFGRARSEMEALLGKRELLEEMAHLPPGDTVLHIDLGARDPDDAFSNVPYEKGYLFLRLLEETVGRERFDAFLSRWFEQNAFMSQTTAGLEAAVIEELFAGNAAAASRIGMQEWLHAPGLPANAPEPKSDAFLLTEEAARSFAAGAQPAEDLPGRSWTTHEWLHFLRSLPADLGTARLAALDRGWRLTASGNSEILMQWLLMRVRARDWQARPALSAFLTGQGRRKFLKPLYTELMKTPEGAEIAREIYRQARPLYHPIARTTIDEIVGAESGPPR